MQDWWNIVVWDNPDLVHFLDCGFNFQTMEEFNQPPYDQVPTVILSKKKIISIVALCKASLFAAVPPLPQM